MINPLVGSFLKLVEGRYSVEAKGMSDGDWICANTTLRNRPFSFNNYAFQKQIADDRHPNMDVMKCSQVGLTETQIRKICAFLARNQGTNGIFSFPNEKMYRKNSTTRIKPLVEENRVFNLVEDTTKQSRSRDLIQIGKSFLHVVNCVEGEATSTPADIVMNDEVDLSDQAMLALFASRLQNSDWKIGQRFGTPSFAGYGIDLSYSASDQHEYMMRCSACGHWQIPEFSRIFCEIPGLPDHIEQLSDIDDDVAGKCDLTNASVVCERCRAPLDLGDPGLREWIPRHPERKHARGYRVRPFTTSRLSIQYIVTQLLQYKRRDYIRGWFNTVIGEAFTDNTVRLSEADIKACMVSSGEPTISSTTPVWMGVDMGQVCHITLGAGSNLNNLIIFRFRTLNVDDLIPTIKEINETFNLVGGACDRHPYTPTANEIMRVTEGKVVPVEYRGQKELNPIKNTEDQITHWQANRTELLDEVAKRVRAQSLKMYGFGLQQFAISEQLRDMVRDEKPEEPATWVKLNNNDHYFHSLGFLCAGVKIRNILENLSGADQRVHVGLIGVESKPTTPLFGTGQKDAGFIYGDRSSMNRRRSIRSA